MKNIIYIPLFLFCYSCSHNTQNQSTNKDSLAIEKHIDTSRALISKRILNIDSVFLINREGKSTEQITENELSEGIPIMLNDTLYRKLIKKRIALSRMSTDSLIEILSREVKIDVGSTKCGAFNPHYSILVFKGNSCSYIDICFHCAMFKSSNYLSPLFFDFRKWDNLKSFFQSKGLDPDTRSK